MNYIDFKSLIEEKCDSIKRNVEDLLNSMLTQIKEDDQANISINLYKQKIHSLTEELQKVKNENILLQNKLQQYKVTNTKPNIPPIKQRTESITHTNINTNRKLLSLKNEIEINNIYTGEFSFSPFVLSDGRIATPSGEDDKSISILSINYELKNWKKDVYKENAHNSCITSFVELSKNRLLSSSNDHTIKIWSIQVNNLIEIKTLTDPSGDVYKITTLSRNRFASASFNNTIRIWNSEEPYNLIIALDTKDSVWNLLFVESKEILISSHEGGLIFWNSQTYGKEHIMKNTYTPGCITSMIELPGQRIAIPSRNLPYRIIIIDLNNYLIVKEIIDKDYLTECASLCLLNKSSFIYVYDEHVIQISLIDYSVLFKTNQAKGLYGLDGIILLKGGRCLLVSNKTKGFNVVTPVYEK